MGWSRRHAGVIPLGAIQHVVFGAPGVHTAVALGLPSSAYALWCLRRAGLSRGELAAALLGSAAAYVPLGVLQSATGVLLDRWIPLPGRTAAGALWAVVTLACAAVALLAGRRASRESTREPIGAVS